MGTIPSLPQLTRWRQEADRRLPDYLRDLETLVRFESGSYSKAGTDAVTSWMAERLAALGGTVERYPDVTLGDTVVATLRGAVGGPRVVLIGHADTVFDDGFLARRPFELRGDVALGPGVSDMKGGLLLGLYALEVLQAVAPSPEAWLPARELAFVVNADEEIGSPASTAVVEQVARDADAAFVLEAARANGDIVSARKGMLHLRVTIEGRAAHAGVEPEKGRSATLEAAHKTVALHALNGCWDGVTVNVGTLAGGTRPNIVAEQAVMTIDMRAARRDDQDQAEAAIVGILGRSSVPGVSASVERLAWTRPMERTPASAELVSLAVGIARQLGFELSDAATGGSSDANTTAAMGIPTLDGLGPVGGDDHTAEEYIQLGSIGPRTALLASLLAAIGGPATASGSA